MICPKCKKEYEGKLNFCRICGEKLVDEIEIIDVIVEGESIAEKEKETLQESVAETENATETETEIENSTQEIAEDVVETAEENITETPTENVSETEIITENSSPEVIEEVVEKETPVQNENPPVENVKKKTGSKIGRKILDVLVSCVLLVLLFVFTSTTAVTIFTREIAKPKNINESVAVFAPLELSIEEFGIKSNGENETVIDYAEDYFGIDAEDIKNIYGDSTLQPFVSGKINDLITNFKNGEDSITITKSDLEKLVAQNIVVIETETGEEIAKEKIDYIYSEIDKIKEINFTLPEITGISSIGSFFGFILSDIFLYIQLGAILLIILCIGLINSSASKAVISSSIVFILVGISIMITNMIILSASVGLIPGLMGEVVYSVRATIFDYIYIIGSNIFVLGPVLITFTLLFKKAKLKK